MKKKKVIIRVDPRKRAKRTSSKATNSSIPPFVRMDEYEPDEANDSDSSHGGNEPSTKKKKTSSKSSAKASSAKSASKKKSASAASASISSSAVTKEEDQELEDGGEEKRYEDSEDHSVLWRVNYEYFIRKFIHKQIENYVHVKINETYASLVGGLLEHTGPAEKSLMDDSSSKPALL